MTRQDKKNAAIHAQRQRPDKARPVPKNKKRQPLHAMLHGFPAMMLAFSTPKHRKPNRYMRRLDPSTRSSAQVKSHLIAKHSYSPAPNSLCSHFRSTRSNQHY